MEITTIVHTHGNPEVTYDTIDSVKQYVSDQILLLVDEAGWHHFSNNLQISTLKGFWHGHGRAPYRNVALGLLNAYKTWPKSDWYCYCEYDALFASSEFKQELKDAWIVGNDLRENQEVDLSLVEKMIKSKFKEKFYFLGACLFFHQDFMCKLATEFIEKFLYYTNDFKYGFFPGYTAWDVTEHLLPTLACHWGGKIKQLAKWTKEACYWSGNFRVYPVRWQPDIFMEECENASIIHPVKKMGQVREFFKKKRNDHRTTNSVTG